VNNHDLVFVIKQVGAPARVGLVAPVDVVVPPGNTGLDPSQTSFFQVIICRCVNILFILRVKYKFSLFYLVTGA
jgi:hypothetical protein